MAKKVLVVDDDPDVMLFSVSVLEEEGYETLEATDGEEGMKIIKKETPDLIILDVLMPRESGIRLQTSVPLPPTLPKASAVNLPAQEIAGPALVVPPDFRSHPPVLLTLPQQARKDLPALAVRIRR